jgi:hypothetical protein
MSRKLPAVDELESPRSILREAIAWCESRAIRSLRTPQLRPRVLESSYRDAVRSVVLARRLHLAGIPLVDDLPNEGRLLAYFPDADLACGAAEAASRGYFDVNNVPPWDTWVFMTGQPDQPRDAYGTCLIAWVPPTFVSRAQRGIEANPEDCICWLDDCAHDVQEVVRNALRM